ncbi:DUF4365 domain-containing protein [Noviluteimonas dokdonensis]|uniref:DUF4365 domain-containing protein n=1 Tax=Noviluteimonas dokdonensis TaxID=414050 RepID=UPI000A070AE2|nr:DUF4365 domain-containing protein [Lysobacter dokdonensis]
MSKQYPKRSVNGDAGEYLAAFLLTRALNWPCRLQSVDLGVDAEIEVCDEQNCATGNVVKVQVKSFETLPSANKHDVYVDSSDISYWQRFSVPTIVVCVDLKSRRIYWKPISATEAYASGGASKKVTFDLLQDELTATSKPRIAALSSPDQFKDLDDLVSQAVEIHNRVTSSAALAISEDELIVIQRESDAFDSIISRIEEIRRHYPWRMSPFTGNAIDRIKSGMFRHLNDAEVSWRNGVNGM